MGFDNRLALRRILTTMMCGALLCALALLVQEGGSSRSMLEGDGIDEYLGDLYGKKTSVFASRDDLGRAAKVNAFARWCGSLLPVLLT